MSKRGMLPKFRPATLGHPASVRPSIRPVKASPPPPAPSPPRRRESGFGPRSERAPESQAAIETERYDEQEMPTAAGVQAPPSTVDRGPSTLPREMAQASPRGGRGNVMQLTFDDETQARAADDRVLDELRREAAAARQQPADLGVDYESLPSLEVRPPYDTFEAAFTERDPVTQARESVHVRRADVREESSYNRDPSYEEPSYQEPSYPAPTDRQQEDELWGRREGSGPRSRPVPDPPQSYAAPIPSYDEASLPWGDPPPPPAADAAPADYPTYEPAAPAAPPASDELRGTPPGFVMGVQPLRTATPDAWVQPQQQMPGQGYLPPVMQTMQHMQPMHGMPAGYVMAPANHQMHPHMVAAYPFMMNPSPYGQPPQQAYYPVQQQQPYLAQPPQQSYPRQASPGPGSSPVMSTSMAGRAQPVSGHLTVAAPSTPAAAKVGRFAWFVAGAAFGITFAFFATGFFNGGKVARDEFPPPAPLPTLTAAAPPAVAAPVAPAVAAPVAPLVMAVAPVAVVQQPTTPSSLPNATVSPPRPAPQFAAPRFSAPRQQAPRFSGRRAPSQGSRSQGDEPAAAAPAAPSGGGDASDLLGAGLKP